MFRKSVLTVFTLMLALAIGLTGVTGAGAAGKVQGTTTITGSAQENAQPATGQGNPSAPVNSYFTYQGRLTSGGAAANGLYDFNFTLWDVSFGGNQIGGMVGTNNLSVNNGYFTVNLDFGPGAFQGQTRWLEIQVRQAGGGSFTTLSPRQQLSAAPYAMSLMPGAVITGTISDPLLTVNSTASGVGLKAQSAGGAGVWGISDGNIGVYGTSNSGVGMYGLSVLNDGLYGTTSGGSTLAGVHGASSSLSGGNGVIGEANGGTSARGVWGKSTSGTGVYGTSTSGAGGYFTSTSYIAVRGDSNSNSNAAIYGVNSGSGPSVMGQGTSGTAVFGLATTGYGVSGISTSSNGVSGSSTSGYGVSGYSSSNTAVYGTSGSGIGVSGSSSGNNGVSGSSTNGFGVYGTSSNYIGVSGYSTSSTGVYGASSSGYGVDGSSINSTGVYGISTNGYGVLGSSTHSHGVSGITVDTSGNYAGVYGGATANNGNGVIGYVSGAGAWGIWGANTSGAGYAGVFTGDVLVNGTLAKSAGSFKIDDPLDPANKYLSHSFVESPDMMNIYNGEATLDSKGEAAVTMPAWFQALNQDFRYQLTAVGAPGPNLYIAQKIVDNHFKIAGGTAGMEVSWQVTGIRHDAYANAHRIPVEQEKPTNERGSYLHPDLFGQPASKSMENSRTGAQNAPASVPTGK